MGLPSRIRSQTDQSSTNCVSPKTVKKIPSRSSPDPPSRPRPTTNHKLPSIGFNAIDNRPSLKPSLSNGNKPKIIKKKKPLPPSKKPDNQNNAILPQKKNKAKENEEKKSGHKRDYSIVKSIPSIFKK